jgi:hypothetical protein
MSTVLKSDITIDAPAEHVWSVLTDLPAYREWNPFIVEAAGTVEPNGVLTLRMRPVGGSVTTVRPRLVAVDPGRRLRWKGRLLAPGVFDAEHEFVLQPSPSGTILTQSEVFSGILVPLFARQLKRATLPAFVAMNEALKRRVEQRAAVAADRE